MIRALVAATILLLAAPSAGGPAPAAARTRFTGCLGKGAATRAPATPSKSRAPESPMGVSVLWDGKELEIRHRLHHLCCLRGHVDVERAGVTLRIVERLEGRGCRCRCQSEITTAVPLAPGTYRLEVVMDRHVELSGTITAAPRKPGPPVPLIEPPAPPPGSSPDPLDF